MSDEMTQEEVVREVASDFNKLFYFLGNQTWHNTRWMGVVLYKFPTDLWVYQEIVHETRPTLIIETGTAHGGSALYFAHLGLVLGGIRVVTVDIDNTKRDAELPRHEAITYITGSSIDPSIVAAVRSQIRPDDRVMVVLDSDHSEAHVRAELDIYAPLVSGGCYLIVEDTNVNGHPVFPEHGPGPLEAVNAFLPTHPEFDVDLTRGKYLLSANPSGYLRRK
jgi:cephalosporin hydroxylase